MLSGSTVASQTISVAAHSSVVQSACLFVDELFVQDLPLAVLPG
jgi:hypothetical protein